MPKLPEPTYLEIREAIEKAMRGWPRGADICYVVRQLLPALHEFTPAEEIQNAPIEKFEFKRETVEHVKGFSILNLYIKSANGEWLLVRSYNNA